MLTIIITYLAFGAFAGILAGLLGIGGGLVIVPIVSLTLLRGGVSPEHIQHLALGTSFSTIFFTSISSFMAHNRKGGVLWPVVFRLTPGIVLGVILGSYIAAMLNTLYLQIFFVCFLAYVSLQMILNVKPKSCRDLPSPTGIALTGGVIGVVSSLVGIGGGTITVPFLTWCNVPMHKSVGTSAAVGMPIALTGMISFIVSGCNVAGLPAYSLGYVYLPATLGIAAASMLTAPLGTALSHRLPVHILKKVFAGMLLIVGARMIWTLVSAQ